MRPLGVPTVVDRALQRCASQVLSAISMSRTPVLLVCGLTGRKEGPAAGCRDSDEATGVSLSRGALILRQLDHGQRATQVASNMGAAAKTARAIARCYEKEGLESALYEKPHPGGRRALDTGQNHRVNLCALTALGLAWRNQSLAA